MIQTCHETTNFNTIGGNYRQREPVEVIVIQGFWRRKAVIEHIITKSRLRQKHTENPAHSHQMEFKWHNKCKLYLACNTNACSFFLCGILVSTDYTVYK